MSFKNEKIYAKKITIKKDFTTGSNLSDGQTLNRNIHNFHSAMECRQLNLMSQMNSLAFFLAPLHICYPWK